MPWPPIQHAQVALAPTNPANSSAVSFLAKTTGHSYLHPFHIALQPGIANYDYEPCVPVALYNHTADASTGCVTVRIMVVPLLAGMAFVPPCAPELAQIS